MSLTDAEEAIMSDTEEDFDYDTDGEDDIMSDIEEDFEYDSSSDYDPSSDDSDTKSEDERPSRRTRPANRRSRRRSHRNHIVCPVPAKWADGDLVPLARRDRDKKLIFDKVFPDLRCLHIPAARCHVIMQAYQAQGENTEETLDFSNKVDASAGQRCSTGNELVSTRRPSSTAPTVFRWMLLPLELQVQILRYHLTTDAPLIDFCFKNAFPLSKIRKRQRYGQRDLWQAILFTCRHLRTLGVPILGRENTFIYTQSDEFTLLNTNPFMKLSHNSFIRKMTIHQDSVPQGYTWFRERILLDTILFSVSVIEQLLPLKILKIKLAPTTIAPY